MLQPPISKHKPAPTPKADKLEEETRSPAGEGQTEVEERDCTVRQFFYLCSERC